MTALIDEFRLTDDEVKAKLRFEDHGQGLRMATKLRENMRVGAEIDAQKLVVKREEAKAMQMESDRNSIERVYKRTGQQRVELFLADNKCKIQQLAGETDPQTFAEHQSQFKAEMNRVREGIFAERDAKIEAIRQQDSAA